MLVDSHLHLQDPVFIPDFADMLERARGAGVKLMLCNSTKRANQLDGPAIGVKNN